MALIYPNGRSESCLCTKATDAVRSSDPRGGTGGLDESPDVHPDKSPRRPEVSALHELSRRLTPPPLPDPPTRNRNLGLSLGDHPVDVHLRID